LKIQSEKKKTTDEVKNPGERAYYTTKKRGPRQGSQQHKRGKDALYLPLNHGVDDEKGKKRGGLLRSAESFRFARKREKGNST